MNIIFSEGSGKNDAVFGANYLPIKLFIESRGEEIEKNSMLKHLFKMGTSQNYGDSFTAMTAMSGFKPVGEAGAYPLDSMEQSYTQELIYDTWKDSFIITQEMVEDSKQLDLEKQPAGFMNSYKRTREKFGAALFGGAMKGLTSTTFEGKPFRIDCADKQALFSKTHPAKADSKLIQSNKFSNAFDVAALGLAETAMHHFKGDTGELLEVHPDTIVIGDNAVLKNDVFAAVGSDKDPVTANNAFNYQCGRWNIIVWPYLDEFITGGDKPWILMDSQYNQTYGGAIWNDRIQLAIKSTVDEQTDNNVWTGRSRFGAIFNDWRAFAIGGVSGGTALS